MNIRNLDSLFYRNDLRKALDKVLSRKKMMKKYFCHKENFIWLEEGCPGIPTDRMNTSNCWLWGGLKSTILAASFGRKLYWFYVLSIEVWEEFSKLVGNRSPPSNVARTATS